jgi:hypothetical protein
MRLHALFFAALLPAGLLAAPADPGPLEFEPKVGNAGTRVVVKDIPKGASVRFGDRTLTLAPEKDGRAAFVVPDSVRSSFIEIVYQGKVISKSAVPFVVAGPSFAGIPKLIGLKEAIDVFGYSDPTPEGSDLLPDKSKTVLRLGDSDFLTLNETAARYPQPAVSLGDAASAATTGMGPAAFTITARPPKKKIPNPPPPPQE